MENMLNIINIKAFINVIKLPVYNIDKQYYFNNIKLAEYKDVKKMSLSDPIHSQR